MSSRMFPIYFSSRDCYGPEVYTQPKAKPTGFKPVF
jgi:hypothetical protein